MEKLAINGGTPVRTKDWPRWPEFDEEDVQAVADVIRSGCWGVGCGRVQEFEEQFAEYCGAKYGIAMNSGTTALQIALQAAGIGPGDEVIVPDYTFVATATAVLAVGAVPVFADIDPNTYNLSPASVEAAITPLTKAVIPVHFSGARADMVAFGKLAERYGLILVEDAAHAHGAHYTGPQTGINPVGIAACFSFQASKNLNAGEGGFILTNDEVFSRRCQSLVNCGRSTISPVWYGHHLPAGNYRMTEMQGALLKSQMRRLDDQVERRNANGIYLSEKLSAIPGLKPVERGEQTLRHPHHLYMIRYDAEGFGGLDRKVFLRMLRKEGIPASNGYEVPLHQQPLFSGKDVADELPRPAFHREIKDYNQVSNPVAERACASEGIWIEQRVLLAEREDMDDIIAAIQKVRENALAGVTV